MIQGQKYRWIIPDISSSNVLDIAHAYNLSVPIAHTLLARGFTTKEKIDEYLFTSFEKDVAHSGLLRDAHKTVARIMQAIEHQEKILIFGDYDVDGITSSSLMLLCLKPLGAAINFFLPHRVKDGYGLSTTVVERAARNGYKLIITVDNGITAVEPAQRAWQLGIDLIITDHHRPHGNLPRAFAIVNPNQYDCAYPYKALAGVGVTFKVLSLLYEKLGKEMPTKAYELLLLGTIADVVPLTGENRYWVRHGLHVVQQAESYALSVLKKNGNIQSAVMSSQDIGFGITPQINALGRLEDPRQAVSFLIGADKAEIEYVGSVLYELNQARKNIEKAIFSEIALQIEQGAIDLEREYVLIASSSNWPPGIIGLVASRLVAAYARPVLLFHVTKQGKAKGSCRSIPAFNIFNALHQSASLLDTFGGHSLAAGLSLDVAKLPELKRNLEECITGQLSPEDFVPTITLDAELTLPEANKKIVDDMALLEPFGHENSKPTFYVRDVTLLKPPQLLKDVHVKCLLFNQGIIKPAIFFNRPELYPWLLEHQNKSLSFTVNVVKNTWQDKDSIEFVGIDVAL